jgi:hypothetical protein
MTEKCDRRRTNSDNFPYRQKSRLPNITLLAADALRYLTLHITASKVTSTLKIFNVCTIDNFH